MAEAAVLETAPNPPAEADGESAATETGGAEGEPAAKRAKEGVLPSPEAPEDGLPSFEEDAEQEQADGCAAHAGDVGETPAPARPDIAEIQTETVADPSDPQQVPSDQVQSAADHTGSPVRQRYRSRSPRRQESVAVPGEPAASVSASASDHGAESEVAASQGAAAKAEAGAPADDGSVVRPVQEQTPDLDPPPGEPGPTLFQGGLPSPPTQLPPPLFPPPLMPRLGPQVPGMTLPGMVHPGVVPPGVVPPGVLPSGVVSQGIVPPGVHPGLNPRAMQMMAMGGWRPQMVGPPQRGVGFPGAPPGGVIEVWHAYLTTYRRYTAQLCAQAQHAAQMKPETDPAQFPSAAAVGGPKPDKVCVHHLSGSCRKAWRCPDKHPVDGQFRNFTRDFKRKVCQFGDQCFSQKCLFYHPREGNEWGDRGSQEDPPQSEAIPADTRPEATGEDVADTDAAAEPLAEATLEAAAEAATEATPDAMLEPPPGSTAKAVAEATADATPEVAAEVAAEATASATLEAAAKATVEATPDAAPEDSAHANAEATPDAAPAASADTNVEVKADALLEAVAEVPAAAATDVTPESVPKHTAEGAAETVAEAATSNTAEVTAKPLAAPADPISASD